MAIPNNRYMYYMVMYMMHEYIHREVNVPNFITHKFREAPALFEELFITK